MLYIMYEYYVWIFICMNMYNIMLYIMYEYL